MCVCVSVSVCVCVCVLCARLRDGHEISLRTAGLRINIRSLLLYYYCRFLLIVICLGHFYCYCHYYCQCSFSFSHFISFVSVVQLFNLNCFDNLYYYYYCLCSVYDLF